MNLQSLIAHPVARSVVAVLLTAALAWAGGSSTGGATATRKADARCDSTRAALVARAEAAEADAARLAAEIARRDAAYAAWKARQRDVAAAAPRERLVERERVVEVRERRGASPWLVGALAGAGGFLLGHVIGHSHPVTVIATAAASASADAGGKGGKTKRSYKKWKKKGCKP